MGWSGLVIFSMEEEKLLRLLVLILINLICMNAIASSEDIEWANSVAERDRKLFVDNLKDMVQGKGFDSSTRESVLKPRPTLQIFVSSSMPKQLLKTYAREASRYDGVLVFNGLPSGSFRRLTELVMEISDENTAAMQIDDEAFKAYGVNVVPTIVLSKSASMFDEQTQAGTFDKVRGNITIKGALTLFANNGDMHKEAGELLK